MQATHNVDLSTHIVGLECQALEQLPAQQDPKNFVPLVLHLPNGQVVQMWLGACKKIQVLVEPKGEKT